MTTAIMLLLPILEEAESSHSNTTCYHSNWSLPPPFSFRHHVNGTPAPTAEGCGWKHAELPHHTLDMGLQQHCSRYGRRGLLVAKNWYEEESFSPHKAPASTFNLYKPSEPAAWVRKSCFSGMQIFSILFAESVLIFPFNVTTTFLLTITSKGVWHSHIRFLLAGSQQSEYCLKKLKMQVKYYYQQPCSLCI